jgi:ribosomal protein S18 acetylase RimI-like enzyme
MKKTVLRDVRSEDLLFLQAVYSSTRVEELQLTDWSEEQKAAFCLQQFNAQDVHYRKYYASAQFSVIEHNGIPAGRLYVDRCTREIRIIDITLLPEFRGVGIGTEILLDLQKEARAAGKSLSIHVERMNRALCLYERLGFRLVEDKGIYLLMEWKP